MKRLHFTIGTYPRRDVGRDLPLVKAALLYADSATLVSFTSSVMLDLVALGSISHEEKLNRLIASAPELGFDQAAVETLAEGKRDFERLSRSRRRTRNEIIWLQRFQRFLSQQWNTLYDQVWQIVRAAGADSIVDAMRTGLLEVKPFQHVGEAAAYEFLDRLGEVVRDASTHPLFDADVGNLVRLAVRDGRVSVSPTGLLRGKHASLAADLLSRLPLFDEASIDEIMEIRRTLDGPLVRFRGAVVRLADTIESLPWDEDFTSEADILFVRDVAPAVEEIRDAVVSDPLLARLACSAVSKPIPAASGSVFGILIAPALDLPQAVGIGLGLAAAGYKEYREWKKDTARLRQNAMYFFYRAGELLSK